MHCHPHHRRRIENSGLDNVNNDDGNTATLPFNLNDNVDVLAEILSRLDGRALGLAACVCRLWSSMCRQDAVWEQLCGGKVAEEEKSVVVALGGYRRLYRICVGPVQNRMQDVGRSRSIRWGRHEVQLSMSLFSIDCYERLGCGSRGSSLMFLCKAR